MHVFVLLACCSPFKIAVAATAAACMLCCRLFFDARGESDLRHPMTSSLAIVELQPVAAQQSVPASAVAAGPGSSAAGAVAIDWSRKQGVFFPDDCQLIASKRGHYKVGGSCLQESLQENFAGVVRTA
jgi:hypothetical protein